jgi:hypothetical protein
MAKKEAKPKVKCFDCKKPELFQWDNNPIIAKCPHLLYRQVANALRTCNLFEKRIKEPIIKHFTHHL